MIDFLKYYKVSILIKGTDFFPGVSLGSDLMITHLIKAKGDNYKIEHIEYKCGTVYRDVSIEDISMTDVDPKIYHSISEKFTRYILKHGSIQDVIETVSSKEKCSVAQLRGHRTPHGGLWNDFYTLFSKNDIENMNSNFGVQTLYKDNFYDYLEKHMPRFGLALTKFNIHNNTGELKTVPLVDFSRTYTDEELFDMIGLNEVEIQAIKKVIKPWNHYGPQENFV